MKPNKLRGFTTNWEKYKKLKNTYWKDLPGTAMYCELHDTYFNSYGAYSEPCWQCVNMCEEEVAEVKSVKRNDAVDKGPTEEGGAE